MSNGWPSLEFYAQAQKLEDIDTPALQVLANQALVAGPAAVPVAVLAESSCSNESWRCSPISSTPDDHGHGDGPVQVHGHGHGSDHDHDHGHDHGHVGF